MVVWLCGCVVVWFYGSVIRVGGWTGACCGCVVQWFGLVDGQVRAGLCGSVVWSVDGQVHAYMSELLP